MLKLTSRILVDCLGLVDFSAALLPGNVSYERSMLKPMLLTNHKRCTDATRGRRPPGRAMKRYKNRKEGQTNHYSKQKAGSDMGSTSNQSREKPAPTLGCSR